ncbi:hypothetical protein [Paenibacillus tyrfis]|uniref:hypothetical protein n=1 Tax=Paenibacillus tyrfis TaxID=1501230 RepID=UPI0013783A5B|nr:hypothetical protein [Paenibacillus tyrfis]
MFGITERGSFNAKSGLPHSGDGSSSMPAAFQKEKSIVHAGGGVKKTLGLAIPNQSKPE